MWIMAGWFRLEVRTAEVSGKCRGRFLIRISNRTVYHKWQRRNALLSELGLQLFLMDTSSAVRNGEEHPLLSYYKASTLKGIVIAERTRMTEQFIPPVQNFVVLELGMAFLPVANHTEAAQLISHMVHNRSREGGNNPFLAKKNCRLLDSFVVRTLQTIHGVGRVKALQLLQRFPSIQVLANASLKELEAVVGRAAASNVHAFFTKTM
ncbi:Fanconi anemia core complex-associated protein 24 isoform X2 [Hyperolius riggenbachi]|uniref:Fanconi anemia core complex-associated protein 24 isoform X2 n=1 Tax=Hyperolius riggenbachi TaxID=752182 RepID=UPI0035A2B68B